MKHLAAAALGCLLMACQQQSALKDVNRLMLRDPPSAGTQTAANSADCPAATTADWLDLMPSHTRRLLPLDCERVSRTPLFSWAEPRDRNTLVPWSFALRRKDSGATVHARADLAAPRLILNQQLVSGDYEWAVSYVNTRGARVQGLWRRFAIEPVPTSSAQSTKSASLTSASALASAAASPIPEGVTLSANAAAKARPRLLPAGSSFAQIATVAKSGDYLPVLTALRASARFALSQTVAAIPATPSSAGELAKVQGDRLIRQSARTEREYIEVLSVIGRIDSNAAMLSSAKTRLLSLAAWQPGGVSSEAVNDQANREVYLALATGLDLLWADLSAPERAAITASLRSRVNQAFASLAYLDKEPYDSHRISNVRWLSQALVLAAGLNGFPEAQTLLAQVWDLSQFTLGAWGSKDGSFGNGIAYGWYAFVSTVPYVATIRVATGVDLYQLNYLRRAGEQLMAFTAPNRNQPSAFGDETETQELYAYYASNYYRLHAQMTRDPVDAWYWQVNPANVAKPNQPQVWQLLLLGVDSSPLPAPQAPSRAGWYFSEAGIAAIHTNPALSARTSLFFRASQFGAFNHSHADQNSLVYTSQGQPLLVNAGYYPYYNSPHHKSVARATRYKNALTFDGGYGQSESQAGATRPSDPLHSMDASGQLLRAEDRGSLSLLTGDATAAYRAVNPSTGNWVPLLSNAVRSVVMDRASGVTLVYDWATSAAPRRWELNYHSPNAFNADAATVKASNGSASVCLDRYGPASSFTQTSAWDVAPEVSQPPQAHGRFAVLTPSTELAHLTVLRDGCRIQPVQVQQQGTRIQVTLGAQAIVFDKRAATVSP